MNNDSVSSQIFILATDLESSRMLQHGQPNELRRCDGGQRYCPCGIGHSVHTHCVRLHSAPCMYSECSENILRLCSALKEGTNTANMRLVQFVYKNKPDEIRAGCLDDDKVIDINKCDPSSPSTLLDILKDECLCKVYKLQKSNPRAERMCDVELAAPITGMDKVLCIAMNYTDFCKENDVPLPKYPIYINKFPSCIIGQNEPIRVRTDVAQKIDWEVELAFVIAKKCTNVKEEYAMTFVLGYTIAQDITSRDWQKQNGGHFLLGKAQDTFCPLGPCIVTSDEVGDPHQLYMKCSVNGVEKQNSNTSNLVHRIPIIIERLSSVITLLPGDIVLTGTPAGVGANHSPPEFLKPGDVVRSEIEKIGAFEVKVAAF